MLPPNVHHLELFYYVAKFGGITPAVRKMPYGIQQPAVSGQMLQLERDLGVKLFNRRPFALTPAGDELYTFISPFFSRLTQVAGKLRGEEGVHLRLAASGTVLANHLPDVLERIREQQPELRLTLREAVQLADIEPLLAAQEIDLAVTTLDGQLPSPIKSIELLRLPLILICRDGEGAKSFGTLCNAGRSQIGEPLVSLSAEHALNAIFQRELEKRELVWEPRVEVSALELVANYVGRGYGYGLTIDAPGIEIPAGLRKIPLRGFPPLRIGLLFQGKLKPIAEQFALAAAEVAKTLR